MQQGRVAGAPGHQHRVEGLRRVEQPARQRHPQVEGQRPVLERRDVEPVDRMAQMASAQYRPLELVVAVVARVRAPAAAWSSNTASATAHGAGFASSADQRREWDACGHQRAASVQDRPHSEHRATHHRLGPVGRIDGPTRSATMSSTRPTTSSKPRSTTTAWSRAGKIKVVATKPMVTQRDLALAYSPGVAYACEAIVADPNAGQRAHRARQPGRGDHQRHRRARPGRHRPARRQAGDGRQGRAVPEVRRHRRVRHRDRRDATRTSWSTSSPRSSRPSAASTSRTSRRRSASSSSASCASG